MRFFTLLTLALLLFSPQTGAAQFLPNATTNSVTIGTAPLFPAPGEIYTVSLDAYTIETTGTTITWLVDGVVLTEHTNERSFELTNKSLGKSTTITATLTYPNGQTLSGSRTVRARRVDVVIEAQTITPAFYQGRALPSAGSVVRAVALPDLGDDRAPQAFSYLWKLDNQVLFGGPLTGGYIANIKLGLNKNPIISVDVFDKNGQAVARKTIGITLVTPELKFYEENPLRGMSQKVLPEPFILATDETSVRAEPYYMDNDIFTKDLLLEWKIDGRTIPEQNLNPDNKQSLTLQKQTTSGSAQVEFHIRNLSQLLQGVRDSFVVTF